jgi:hypothetical protein
MAGYQNTTDIYDEYKNRSQLLKQLVADEVEDYYKVTEFIWNFYRRKTGILSVET